MVTPGEPVPKRSSRQNQQPPHNRDRGAPARRAGARRAPHGAAGSGAARVRYSACFLPTEPLPAARGPASRAAEHLRFAGGTKYPTIVRSHRGHPSRASGTRAGLSPGAIAARRGRTHPAAAARRGTVPSPETGKTRSRGGKT